LIVPLLARRFFLHGPLHIAAAKLPPPVYLERHLLDIMQLYHFLVIFYLTIYALSAGQAGFQAMLDNHILELIEALCSRWNTNQQQIPNRQSYSLNPFDPLTL
jgi:hypothetical protein